MLTFTSKLSKLLQTQLKASLTTKAPYAKNANRPLNIAHRGCAGLFPQNTIQSFEAALYSGADFIELDVVFTQDNELLVMHDPYLSRITDVNNHPEFAQTEERFYASEGIKRTEAWTDRYKLWDLRKLTIKQKQAQGRIKSLDNYFGFPILSDVIRLVKKFNKEKKPSNFKKDHKAGILIEAKDGDMYRKIYGQKKSIGKKILEVLKQQGVDTWQSSMNNQCPIYLHSFDKYTVQEWHECGSDLPSNLLIEQITFPKNKTIIEAAKQASNFCHGLGLESNFLWDYTTNKPKLQQVKAIKQAGMLTHIWTFKDDDRIFNAKDYLEMYRIGQNVLQLDGVITEFPDVYKPVSHFLELEKKKSRK